MDSKLIFQLRAEEAQYTAEQIREEILCHLAEKTLIDKENIHEENRLNKDLSLDSLEGVELIMWCEAKFHIAIDYPEPDQIATVGQLIEIVKQKHLNLCTTEKQLRQL